MTLSIRSLAAVLWFGIAALVGSPEPGRAADGDAGDFAFVQRPGAALPLGTRLTEADGRAVRLGDVFGNHPVVLALGYFHCPNLCGVVRDDLFEALSHSGLRTPDDYELLSISIDPAETPADAAAALADDRDRYPAPGADKGWHFLTGDAATLEAIEQAVGFRSRYDVHLRQFLHPAGVVVLTQDGIVSGYLLGVGYQAGDLRTAVTLASSGGIAKAALPILLLCFHFDGATGRYSLEIMKVLRLAAMVTVLTIGGSLLLAWRRARRTTEAS